MKKNIAIFGSTGSIGTQTLDVIASLPEQFEITALAAGQNIDLLEHQVRCYQPGMVVVGDSQKAVEFSQKIKDLNIRVLSGSDGLVQMADEAPYDTMVMALAGNLGLVPVMSAIDRGAQIAIATKEVLVSAGELVMRRAHETGSQLIPVDSEHSALFQCLQGEDPAAVEKLILTASGGPFRTFSKEAMGKVTPEQALKHPNWDMGRKITVDSATMINKGLEVLEAKWLFSVPMESIDVLVHPQSIVHSLIQFVDGSVLAQLGMPDMRGPIQYALTYPQRCRSNLERLDLASVATLSFEKPDLDRFPGLRLAYQAGQAGGTMPAVFNAANEEAVELFLNRDISFHRIPILVERIMEKHDQRINPNLDEILQADQWARTEARSDKESMSGDRKKV